MRNGLHLDVDGEGHADGNGIGSGTQAERPGWGKHSCGARWRNPWKEGQAGPKRLGIDGGCSGNRTRKEASKVGRVVGANDTPQQR